MIGDEGCEASCCICRWCKRNVAGYDDGDCSGCGDCKDGDDLLLECGAADSEVEELLGGV